MIDFSNIRTNVISTVSALALTGTALALAGIPLPANAAETSTTTAAPATVADWHARVEHAVSKTMQQAQKPSGLREGDLLTAKVAVSFDAAGNATGSRLLRSTGLWSADKEARTVAERIAYPRLPVALQGKPRQVVLELHFGTALTEERMMEAAAERREQTAATIHNIDTRTIRQAGNTPAQPAG